LLKCKGRRQPHTAKAGREAGVLQCTAKSDVGLCCWLENVDNYHAFDLPDCRHCSLVSMTPYGAWR